MTTLAARAHANLAGFIRLLSRLDDGPLLAERGVCAVLGTSDWPSSRVAVRTGPDLTPAAWADTIEEFFFAADRGKTAAAELRISDDDDLATELETRGWREFAQTPEMVCEHPLPDRPLPDGVRVRLAKTAADVHDYARIAGHAFKHLSVPSRITRTTIDNPAVMLGADIAIAIADIDGVPVAGAMVALVGDEPNGYVGWVACVDEGRGRGLGDVVTRRVTNEAFARGAGMVSLEASQFGESTYARMGYRELYRYRMLIKI